MRPAGMPSCFVDRTISATRDGGEGIENKLFVGRLSQ
jgi:hypothetical protein